MRVFSGIQPTGVLQLGNYFGAVRHWVELQQRAQCLYCVVDYHALTNEGTSPDELRHSWRGLVLDLMACGIDPERSIVFIQSDVPEHTELCWILGCVTSFGDLSRMTQFKEKAKEHSFVNAALFYYPVLQAADILLYLADRVPVGEDQVQHLEISRRIARRFNSRFGQLFPEPEALVGSGARVMSLADPARKMSKSAGPEHYIGVNEPEEEILRKVRTAVTDCGLTPGREMSPGVANLFSILELVAPDGVVAEFREAHSAGSLLYRDLKQVLFRQLMDELAPVRKRRAELERSVNLDELMREGARRARAIAGEVLEEVRSRVGLA